MSNLPCTQGRRHAPLLLPVFCLHWQPAALAPPPGGLFQQQWSVGCVHPAQIWGSQEAAHRKCKTCKQPAHHTGRASLEEPHWESLVSSIQQLLPQHMIGWFKPCSRHPSPLLPGPPLHPSHSAAPAPLPGGHVRQLRTAVLLRATKGLYTQKVLVCVAFNMHWAPALSAKCASWTKRCIL